MVDCWQHQRCEALLKAGFARVECINAPGTPLEEAMLQEVAMEGIRCTVLELLRGEGV